MKTTAILKLMTTGLLILAATVFLAACSSSGDDAPGNTGDAAEHVDDATATAAADANSDADSPVVNVELGDFFVTPDVDEIEAGDITFSASNTGAIPHELVIVKTDLSADDLPVVDGRVDEHDASGEFIGEIEEFDAGGTVASTFDLTPGNYVLFCNIPGHYLGGMTTEFTVD